MKVLTYYGADADVTVGLDLNEKIESKIMRQDNGCWIYDGYYTQVRERIAQGEDYLQLVSLPYKGFWVNVRRYLIESINKMPLDREVRIKMTCGEPKCINPEHAGYLVADDQMLVHFEFQRKTHCDKGHDLAIHGKRRTDGVGSMRCDTCRKEYSRAKYLNNRDHYIAYAQAKREAKRAAKANA